MHRFFPSLFFHPKTMRVFYGLHSFLCCWTKKVVIRTISSFTAPIITVKCSPLLKIVLSAIMIIFTSSNSAIIVVQQLNFQSGFSHRAHKIHFRCSDAHGILSHTYNHLGDVPTKVLCGCCNVAITKMVWHEQTCLQCQYVLNIVLNSISHFRYVRMFIRICFLANTFSTNFPTSACSVPKFHLYDIDIVSAR